MQKTEPVPIHPEYREVRQRTCERLVKSGRLSQEDVDQFVSLEEKMNAGGFLDDNFLTSFQKSDDLYKRLLVKVLEALIDFGEPHATEKHRVVLDELGTMGPAVYLTPWEISLAYLDRFYGDFEDVAAFYKE